MVKRLVAMTISKGTGEYYVQQFHELFGDAVSAVSYSMEDGGFVNMQEGDIYIMGATSSDIFEFAISCIPQSAEVVIPNVTLTKKTIERLKQIPSGTKALLVNMSRNMANETVADLYKLGVTNIEFIPQGPDEELPEGITLAITPGESQHCPKGVLEIIDIGHRVFAASTVIELALKLDIPNVIESESCRQFIDKLASKDYGLDKLATLAVELESKLEILLDSIFIGVIGIDMNNTVFAMNHLAQEITGKKREEIIGKTTDLVLRDIPINIFKDKLTKNETRIIHIKGSPISLSTIPIVQRDRFLGFFAIVQRFNDEEIRQQKLRLQLLGKGHKAKYTFEDIIGECPKITNAKAVAKKMAKSSAAVLIFGESGTGKELFSHAIHNYSTRSEMPFVAINCAALPDNLLESELFGYAEGSFTGAKKGGKLGLFEHAHRGTLFLDEIESMSQNLQVKLLRALQEKEIIRLGDDRIINVDVRIIAASNENIKQLVDKGIFRKDLYYRLNALPIDIPPLRERKGDIFLLAEYIKDKIGANFILDDKASDAFLNYIWDGNIRELSNVVEYLNYVGKDIIEYKDLPKVFHEGNKAYLPMAVNINDIESPAIPVPINDLQIFKMVCGKKEQEYTFVLFQLLQAKRLGLSIGRQALSQLSLEASLPLSPQNVRTILQNLEKLGLLRVFRGRQGSEITPKGEQLMVLLKKKVN